MIGRKDRETCPNDPNCGKRPGKDREKTGKRPGKDREKTGKDREKTGKRPGKDREHVQMAKTAGKDREKTGRRPGTAQPAGETIGKPCPNGPNCGRKERGFSRSLFLVISWLFPNYFKYSKSPPMFHEQFFTSHGRETVCEHGILRSVPGQCIVEPSNQ